MKKVNNFQDEFSIQDIEIARDVRATYDCGMSRIALKAPDQVYRLVNRMFSKPKSSSAVIDYRTLKLEYAIQVWIKAALISANNPSNLLYYWSLGWEDTDGPFRTIRYHNFYRDITVDQLLAWFWELLEKIANSGEIKVSEGYQVYGEGVGNTGPKVKCIVILNRDEARGMYKTIEDVYTYNYDITPKSYTWDEIKDFYCEMTLDQLRLTMPDQLHRHSKIDDILLYACDEWDIDLINYAMKKGAYIHSLDKNGESVLQKTVEWYKGHDIYWDREYSEEERKAIQNESEKKCKEIVNLLLSYGADINLFGFEGMSPLICAYYERGIEMIKFLLERGASPNANCYLEDCEYWPELKNIQSTILNVIDGLIYEDYGDEEREIERLVRDAGGRQYVWDYNPWTYGNEGKYVVHMIPSTQGDNIFCDNSRWYIGSVKQLVIEDKDGNQTNIALKGIEGLRQWNADFQANTTNPDYDWQSWKKRGYELACQVANLLSDKVALFYLYENENVVQKAYWHPDHTPSPNELYLCRDGKPIRIE